MRSHRTPIWLISAGVGFGAYALIDSDAWLFAFASILTVCGWHELLAEARSNQSTQRGNR